MRNINDAADEVVDVFIEVMRAQAKLALREDDSVSPKQRSDAAKVVALLGKEILDRNMPKLTASQQTNINVDVARAIAKALPHEQAKALQTTLRSRLLELGVGDGQHERPRTAECIDSSGSGIDGTGEAGGTEEETG